MSGYKCAHLTPRQAQRLGLYILTKYLPPYDPFILKEKKLQEEAGRTVHIVEKNGDLALAVRLRTYG